MLADAEREFFDLSVIGAERLGHTDNDVVAAVALDDAADDLAGERGADGVVDLSGLEIVAAKHGALHAQLELRGAAVGLVFNLGNARRLFEDRLDLLGERFEDVVVGAEDFHGEFGLGAFEHFVETHFDGLGEEQIVVGIDFLQGGLDLHQQFGLGGGATGGLRPFSERFVEEVNVAFVRRHGIGGDGAGADTGKNAGEFGKISAQAVLDLDVGAE